MGHIRGNNISLIYRPITDEELYMKIRELFAKTLISRMMMINSYADVISQALTDYPVDKPFPSDENEYVWDIMIPKDERTC